VYTYPPVGIHSFKERTMDSSQGRKAWSKAPRCSSKRSSQPSTWIFQTSQH